MACRRFHNKYCLRFLKSLGTRNLSTEHAVSPELDATVKDDIENNRIKPRKHPGVMKTGQCSLPDDIVSAITIIAEEHPIRTILNDAKMLANYLFSRHYPWDEEDLKERRAGFVEDVQSRIGELPEDATDETVYHYNTIVKNSVAQLMTKYNYKWSPLDLHDYSCIVYLFTRAAPNYAAAIKVFNEIIRICPDYKPTSLFDFGSGVGSVSWAAKSCWGSSIKEYTNVDSSSSMNNLAESLLCGGKTEINRPTGVFYKGFLPSMHAKHSIVVSAHSLMELPSRENRLNTLLNLWQKTKDFLIIIEQGTKPGFRIVVEARDFILSLANEESPAHVFAPCPHDGACPRLLRGPYPCHFQTTYSDLCVGKKLEIKKELLSYVIIRKDKRKETDQWPRVVRPILKRHNHVICRLCTAHKDLQEIIFTKSKHGKVLYKCAKVTNWGDRLPVKLTAINPNNTSLEGQHKTSDNEDPKPD